MENIYNKILEENKEWVDAFWDKLDAKLRKVAVRSHDKIPYTTIDGVHNNQCDNDITWWTNGFWMGLMWLMYVDTKHEGYMSAAKRGEELLDAAFEDYDKLHHDVGFMWNLSAGVNYALTGDKKSRLRNLYAANLLAGRFNPKGNYIRSWNGDRIGWVIIDCMMNIPLLYWASRETGDNRYRAIAEIHADNTIKTHIRPDGSVNHIVSINPENGEVIESFGGQGYEVGSSWTRGQAWALYGFVLSYIHTRKEEYLDISKRVAHYFIANLSADDWDCRVDFRSPQEPHYIDTTAAAIAACGLIELAKNLPENQKKLYLSSAYKILKKLETYCNFEDNEDSVLQMGTEAYFGREGGHHIPIIYGDYFLAEALYKLRGNDKLFW